MSGLRVETEDFAVAARAVHDRVGDAVAAALARLRQALLQSAGMAGDDPAGQQWARDYDVAAATAMRAAVAGANSVYRLGEMFVQSAHNYEAAEAASTTGAAPPGWSLVMHLVHAAWPNGHQDRLHAAADAWMTCDTALDDGADQLVRAPDVLERDRLPEGEDVRIMCAALAGRLRELAQAHRTLAHACLGRSIGRSSPGAGEFALLRKRSLVPFDLITHRVVPATQSQSRPARDARPEAPAARA